MTVQRVGPDLFQLDLPMPGLLGGVQVYAIRGKEGVTLVDTGMGDDDSYRALCTALGEIGKKVDDIHTVVATHYHPDHCGLAARLQRRGARVVMSVADARDLSAYFSDPGFDRKRALLYGGHDLPARLADDLTPTFSVLRQFHERFVPDRLVVDGETLDLDGFNWMVWETPGHTSGHICLVDQSDQLVLLGDHMLAHSTVHIAPGQEGPGMDLLGAYLASLNRFAAMPSMRGLTGHGDQIKDTRKRANGLRVQYRKRIEQVMAVLGPKPMGVYKLSMLAIGEKRRSFSRWLAASLTLSCLEHLVATGRAQRIEAESVRYCRPVVG